MKKTVFTLVVIGGLLWMAGFAAAGSSQLEGYYDNYITGKINNCCKTVSVLHNCTNHRMGDLKTMRAEQAKFYTENRDQLIRIMVEQGVGKEAHKIDYFLITEFKNGKGKH